MGDSRKMSRAPAYIFYLPRTIWARNVCQACVTRYVVAVQMLVACTATVTQKKQKGGVLFKGRSTSVHLGFHWPSWAQIQYPSSFEVQPSAFIRNIGSIREESTFSLAELHYTTQSGRVILE